MTSQQTNWPYVINLGNSIIGVSILAMPFCFRECGVVLGMLLLLSSSFLTSMSCGLLIKGAISSRKRSYEYLAYHTFGVVGKLAVEVSIIGLLLGTCVAFYVIIGDLGSAIVSKMTGLENTDNLRTCLLVVMGLSVALPLGLLRSVESLSNISALSLSFYLVFVAQVVAASLPNLWSGLWVSSVTYWNTDGIFKCLPIFSLAFSCQTQLFVMYDALPEPSLSRMSQITSGAVGLCTTVYLLVGFFGYVAFCDEEVMGDVLMNFRPTLFSEGIKMGFSLSVAASFPLVIFPCRASLYTLCFAKESAMHDSISGSTYIPPLHFKCITAAIVVLTMIIGIFIPNIEFVLAVTGATMGTMICFIFPAVTYLHITSASKTGSRSSAQIVLFLGIIILVASSYVILKGPEPPVDLGIEGVKLPEAVDQPPLDLNKPADQLPDGDTEIKNPEKQDDDPGGVAQGAVLDEDEEGKRLEPPNPQPPPDSDEGNKQLEEGGGIDVGDQAGVGGDKLVDGAAVPVQNQDDEAIKIDAKLGEMKDTNDEAKAVLAQLKLQQQESNRIIEKQKEVLQKLEEHQVVAHNPDDDRADPVVNGDAQDLPINPPQQLPQMPANQDAAQPPNQGAAQPPNQGVAQPPNQPMHVQQPPPNQGLDSEQQLNQKLPNQIEAVKLPPNQQQAAPNSHLAQAAAVQDKAEPVQGNAAPVQGNAAPVQGNAAPVQDKAAPVQVNAGLAQDKVAPVEGNAGPAPDKVAPAQEVVPVQVQQPTPAHANQPRALLSNKMADQHGAKMHKTHHKRLHSHLDNS